MTDVAPPETLAMLAHSKNVAMDHVSKGEWQKAYDTLVEMRILHGRIFQDMMAQTGGAPNDKSNAFKMSTFLDALLDGRQLIKDVEAKLREMPQDTKLADGILQDITEESIGGAALPLTAPTLVLVYADWCPHCHHFMPTWQELRKKVKMHGGSPFNMLAINSESGDPRVGPIMNFLGTQGFPSIYLVPSDGKNVSEYKGKREMIDILQFVKDFYTKN